MIVRIDACTRNFRATKFVVFKRIIAFIENLLEMPARSIAVVILEAGREYIADLF